MFHHRPVVVADFVRKDRERGDFSIASLEGDLEFLVEEMVERLSANGVSFSERQVNNQALYQVFLREPINGIKVELNFSAEEAVEADLVDAHQDPVQLLGQGARMATATPAIRSVARA